MHSKTKFFNSFVFMVVSAVLLIVAFLGYTNAWFTYSNSDTKMTGSVPVVAVNVQYAGLTQGTNCYTFSQHNADDNSRDPARCDRPGVPVARHTDFREVG